MFWCAGALLVHFCVCLAVMTSDDGDFDACHKRKNRTDLPATMRALVLFGLLGAII